MHRSTPLVTLAAWLAFLLTACDSSGRDASADVGEVPTTVPVSGAANEEPPQTPSTDDHATGLPATEQGSETGDPMLEFQRCMADFGIEATFMDGPGSYSTSYPADLPAATVEEAEAVCTPILDDVLGEFDHNPEAEAERRDRELALRNCLEDHGIDIPDDADPSGGIAVVTGDPDKVDVDGAIVIDADAAELSAAFEACAPGLAGEL